MKMKNIFALAAMALPLFASAQTEITFETQDYKSIGVYDTWEVKHATSIISVLSGKWKLVISASTHFIL